MSRTCKPRAIPGEKHMKVRLENRRYFEQRRAMSRLPIAATAEPSDRPEPPEVRCVTCGANFRPVRFRRLLEGTKEVVKEFATVVIFRRDGYCETCRPRFSLYRFFRHRGLGKKPATAETLRFPIKRST